MHFCREKLIPYSVQATRPIWAKCCKAAKASRHLCGFRSFCGLLPLSYFQHRALGYFISLMDHKITKKRYILSNHIFNAFSCRHCCLMFWKKFVGSFGRKVILVHQKIITYITKVFFLYIHSAQPIDKPEKLIKFFVFSFIYI